MSLFRTVAFALLVLAVPAALIATNIRFAASEVRVYDYSVREYDAAAVSGIPEDELIAANRELVDYFTLDDPGPLSITVRNNAGAEEQLFTARETAHLGDVRDLFQALFTFHVAVVGVALIAAVVLIGSATVRTLAQALLYGSLLTFGIAGGAGVLALMGFDDAWRQFHFLAFTNDLWELDPAKDHLIQMFPRDFWFDMTLLIGGLTLLEAALLGAVTGTYVYLTRAQGPFPFVEPRDPLSRSMEPRPRIPPPRPRHITH